jgi:predicted nucleic acid-binding protein
MIAVDTSALIAFFRGDEVATAKAVDRAFVARQAVLPPVVLTEVLSAPNLPPSLAGLIGELPVLESDSGFWERAAHTRRSLLSRRLRAKLADTLIAQSCIDHDVPLLTLDTDFRHFARLAGLVLA